MNLLRADWRIGGEAHPLRRMRFFCLDTAIMMEKENPDGWEKSLNGAARSNVQKNPRKPKRTLSIYVST